MLTKILFIFILTLISLPDAYTYLISLESTNKYIIDQSSIIGPDGNPLTYSIFNLFDKNSNTAVALNENVPTYYLGSIKKPIIRLIFTSPIEIDKIKILNGYQKNDKVYQLNSRVKSMAIWTYDYFTKKEFVITNFLEDKTSPQTLSMGRKVKIESVLLSILTTYPGTKYDDTCISEIEFWNGNEKYEIANLEQAKKDFLLLMKEEIERRLADLPMVVTFERTDPYYQTLKKMGFEPETIHHGDYYEGYYLEFRKNKKIYLYHPREIFKEKKGLKYINHEKGILIGEWKIDELSRFWIKVGTGEWKFIRNGEWAKLKGTDLEAQDVDMGNSVYEELAHGRGW